MSLTIDDIQKLLDKSLESALAPLRTANTNLESELRDLRTGLDLSSSTATERQTKSRVAQEEREAAIARIKSRLQESDVSFSEDEFNVSPSQEKKVMKVSDLNEFDGSDVYSFQLSVDAALAQFSSPTVAGMMARVLKGVAKTWFQNLDHRIRDGCLVDADEFIHALKSEFAIDKGLARQSARDRRWKVNEESVSSYYYDKLKLVGNSYGSSMDATEKCFEVRDGLPEDFKVLVRTTLASRPTLEALRKELTTLEVDYLASQKSKAVVKVPATQTLPPSPVKALSPAIPPVMVPRIKQENFAGQRRLSMKDSFDSRFIGTAPNPVNPSEMTRTYSVPDGSGRVLYLNRPCRQCGGQHFDFEPNHGKAQAHVATGSDTSRDTDDYTLASSSDSSYSEDSTYPQLFGHPAQVFTTYQPSDHWAHQPTQYYSYPISGQAYGYPSQTMGFANNSPFVSSYPVSHAQWGSYPTQISEFYSRAAAPDPTVIEDNDSYPCVPTQRMISQYQSTPSPFSQSKN